MQKINSQEQNILTAAALLHDSGKLMTEKQHKSFKHWNKILKFIKSTDFKASESLSQVLADLFNEKDLDENRLAYYIVRAHELLNADTGSTYSFKPLKSIFSKVDIGKAKKSEDKYCLPSKLSPVNSFPVEKNAIKDENLNEVSQAFRQELNKILRPGLEENTCKNLHSLIGKYAWSYPEEENKDKTLLDHVYLITALSVILNRLSNEEDKPQKQFMLIGGDLSGIQSYIYDIARTNIGGVSKRLRARSFFVSVLGDAIMYQLLNKLKLPLACKIISAGGKFYLLAPNTKNTEQIILNQSKNINSWFYEKLQSELYYNFSSVKFAGSELNNFGSLYEEINEKLEAEKKNKFNNFLDEGSSFQLDAQYGPNSDICDSCRKLWVEERVDVQKEEAELCQFCRQDLEIGKDLTKANYIGFNFADNPNESFDFKLFDSDPIYVSLLNNKSENKSYELIKNIKDNNISPAYPEILGTYSSYIPTFTDKEEKEELCDSCSDVECSERNNYYRDFPYLFSCLGASSAADKDTGLQALGVLKADVDFLGSIFSIGLGAEKVNYSDITTLSRMTDYYFSKVLPANFAGNKKITYNSCTGQLDKNYIVYAGGDDLLILGPWDNLTLTAFYINESFRSYTAQNNNITISAGLSLVKPKYPIARSSKMATAEEEKAKESGRNAFSIFGESRNWQTWLDSLPLANLLDEALENDHFSMNFVRRLKKYADQEKAYQESKDAEKRKWKAMFQYDLGRNFYGKSEYKKSSKLKEALKRLLDLYFKEKDDGSRGVENFKLPYHWSLYRNRD